MFKKILNFIFPEKCSGCGKYGNFLCENCAKNFLEREKKFFNLDSRLHGNDKACGAKIFEKIYSPFFYKKNPVLKKILKEIKYKNKFSKFGGLQEKIFSEFEKFLKNILAKGNGTARVPVPNIYLIPTPLHWKKILKRGFNQSEIFCDFLEKKGSGKKINLIQKIKNTKAQAECHKKERLINLEGAFKIKNKNISKEENIFILIDDIFSTGSTMKNCGIEIKKNFPNSKIYGFAICSDVF